MRIGYYNHTSSISGAEISLLTMTSHLHTAEPVIIGPEGELGVRAREFGMEYLVLPGYRARLSKNPFSIARHMIGMVVEGWRLAACVKKQNLDIVHANSIRAGIMASMFSWLHRRPVIWHIRDQPPRGIVGAVIRKFAARKADKLICISEQIRESLGKALEYKSTVIYNGVKADFADDQEKQQARQMIRAELGAEQETLVIAIIGQIAPWKRQEDAIAALHLLQKQNHFAELWIVGEAKFREENKQYEQHLRRLVKELGLTGKVRFTGFRNDMKEICCAADLLFLCSDNEPFGRVLIESMAQKVPVIATRAGGVPEIVEDENCGLLYEVGDIVALAACASRLLSDESLRKEYGQKAFERVKARFVIQNTVMQVENLYDQSGQDRPLRVAIVHDYLNQRGGAERVVGVLHKIYPEAPIFTTIADRNELLAELADADIRTTWMQRIPGILSKFKLFFWVYPAAVKSMDLRKYDLIISSSSAYAKGIRKPKGAVHICYCHTPMRFAWNYEEYVEGMMIPSFVKRLAKVFVPFLKGWDKRNTAAVDALIANSTVVRERVNTYYGMHSSVVYPPVDLSRFGPYQPVQVKDYYLVVSRLVSYKRIDLAVAACTLTNQNLIVVGGGPDLDRLKKLAGPTITFAGRLKDDEVEELMRGCKALLFPGIEDFGITPLEANACGRPVIAFQGGGALDTIIAGRNGLFFTEQTKESLAQTMRVFDQYEWDSTAIHAHAEAFGEARFERELKEIVVHATMEKNASLPHSTLVGRNVELD
ncbi:glycosyltransferase family 4 protein [Paenibacillus herberti]|nr:glycosyltransferase [Paenibacillus herberti]